jgi:hypothetical protein
MKRPPRKSSPRRLDPRPDGRTGAKPTPGWKPRLRVGAWVNPRPPSVPSTMDLRLDEYYAGAALIGVIASQGEEPDTKWVREWTWKLADQMCADALKRRRRTRTR